MLPSRIWLFNSILDPLTELTNGCTTRSFRVTRSWFRVQVALLTHSPIVWITQCNGIHKVLIAFVVENSYPISQSEIKWNPVQKKIINILTGYTFLLMMLPKLVSFLMDKFQETVIIFCHHNNTGESEVHFLMAVYKVFLMLQCWCSPYYLSI